MKPIDERKEWINITGNAWMADRYEAGNQCRSICKYVVYCMTIGIQPLYLPFISKDTILN